MRSEWVRRDRLGFAYGLSQVWQAGSPVEGGGPGDLHGDGAPVRASRQGRLWAAGRPTEEKKKVFQSSVLKRLRRRAR